MANRLPPIGPDCARRPLGLASPHANHSRTRLATDIPQIARIWETGRHEAHAEIVPPELVALRTTQSFLERSAHHLTLTCVTRSNDCATGCCMVKEDELYQIYVALSARGTGAAQALISDAKSRIAAAGHTTAWLACSIGNDRAAHFYEKSGWTNARTQTVDLETPTGPFPLKIWRYEISLHHK